MFVVGSVMFVSVFVVAFPTDACGSAVTLWLGGDSSGYSVHYLYLCYAHIRATTFPGANATTAYVLIQSMARTHK